MFGHDFESVLQSLELVLIRLAEYGLQLKSTKCNLFRSSVPFLGHIVGRAGLECDPSKVSSVANWIPPSTIKGVRIEGTEHVIAYYSKSLNPAQQKYCTTRRETISGGGHPGPLQGLCMGPEVCGTYRSCCASLVEESEKHSRNASTLVGETATIFILRSFIDPARSMGTRMDCPDALNATGGHARPT